MAVQGTRGVGFLITHWQRLSHAAVATTGIGEMRFMLSFQYGTGPIRFRVARRIAPSQRAISALVPNRTKELS
jgi:hypothetical protein